MKLQLCLQLFTFYVSFASVDSKYYKSSHKGEWNTEKYSASASQAELGMGHRRAIFSVFPQVCDNEIFKQTRRVT